MGEKEKLLSKLNIKDYRNDLELVLENKQFDEEAKSLLLSIFYKLDNFYKDYMIVKRECEQKNKFLEEYINILKNKCNKIQILTPQECTKTKRYTINKEKGEIKSFPSEIILLYAVYELNEYNERKESKTDDFTNNCINFLLNKGKTINSIEPIRDFNGWSWNVEINNTKNIEYNLIFQNLLILFGYNFLDENINKSNIISALKNKVNTENFGKKGYEFLECLFQLCILIYNNNSTENHNKCLKYKKSLINKINMLNNRKEYIDDKTKSNTILIKQIQKIDIMLNDINLIRKEFEKNIKSQEDKYFSISDFVDDLEVKRQDLLKQIENNNKLLSPKEYLKNQDDYVKILNLYNSIKEEQEKVNIQTKLIKLQKTFLECIKLKISNTENKRDLYNITTQLRYYANVPYKKNKSVVNQEKVWQTFEDVIKQLIYKMVEYKVIDIGFRTKKLNYEVLKYIFKTKIIRLDNLVLKISFISNNQIEVQYYDGNMLDYKECFDIPFDEEIISKKDRKIKLFKIS